MSSLKVGKRSPHTLHLNVRGSLILLIVIVLVLNTPFLLFSGFTSTVEAAPAVVLSGDGPPVSSGSIASSFLTGRSVSYVTMSDTGLGVSSGSVSFVWFSGGS